MPQPFVTITGQSGTGPFSFNTIEFMTNQSKGSQLQVYRDGTKLIQGALSSGADYTVGETSSTITLAVALTGSETLQIRRETNDLNRISSFSDGTKLSANTLNQSLDQLFFLIQEKSIYSTTVENFPTSLINVSGISNRDMLQWEAAQGKFVATGSPNLDLNKMTDVTYDASTIESGQVLAWGGTAWEPSTNVSYDPSGNATFSGNVTFSNPVTVPSATSNSHAVNRGQIDALLDEHADNYTHGFQQRILDLEAAQRIILGRGRYWNTVGNYTPKLAPGATSQTTFPVFDTQTGRGDWENLGNLSCSGASYVPMYSVCAMASQYVGFADNGSGTETPHATAFLDRVEWDVWTWDFLFDDATIVDENSRNSVPSNQYHVLIDVEGCDDTWVPATSNGGNSTNYRWRLAEFGQDLKESPIGGSYGEALTLRRSYMPGRSTGTNEERWPFYMNLHAYAGGKPTAQDVAGNRNAGVPLVFDVAEGPGLDANVNYYIPHLETWGGQHYYQGHNGNTAPIADGPLDKYGGMGGITEPMTLFGVFNKEITGFTVMYAIRRPATFWLSLAGATAAQVQAARWKIHAFLHKTAGATANEPSANYYSGHPLKQDFNFNISVIK